MNKQATMEERLWDWMDGLCTAEEGTAVQQLVATQPEWKEKHQALLAVHQSLKADIELMQPSLRFAKNVMDQIAALSIQTTTRRYLNNKIVYGIGGLFVAMLSAVVLYAIAVVDWAAGGSSFKMPDSKIDSINWGGLVQGPAGTAAVIIMSVLGMALLDQYLRPKLLKR
jgi:hypothetical protein